MTNIKKDRKKTAKIVLPKKRRGKDDPARYDFSGYDTKNRKDVKPRKVRTGPRGGKYVLVKGNKRYLRS